jgi:hypothetical protein
MMLVLGSSQYELKTAKREKPDLQPDIDKISAKG